MLEECARYRHMPTHKDLPRPSEELYGSAVLWHHRVYQRTLPDAQVLRDDMFGAFQELHDGQETR